MFFLVVFGSLSFRQFMISGDWQWLLLTQTHLLLLLFAISKETRRI